MERDAERKNDAPSCMNLGVLVEVSDDPGKRPPGVCVLVEHFGFHFSP